MVDNVKMAVESKLFFVENSDGDTIPIKTRSMVLHWSNHGYSELRRVTKTRRRGVDRYTVHQWVERRVMIAGCTPSLEQPNPRWVTTERFDRDEFVEWLHRFVGPRAEEMTEELDNA